MKSEIGVVGLGAIGGAFLANLLEKGFSCVGYDKEKGRHECLSGEINLANSLADFFERIERPRKILIFVPADKVDEVIQNSLDYLERGDILVDAGNSHFLDTERRYSFLKSKGVEFAGVGISGGLEGARKGASIMFGGERKIYELFYPIFEATSAKFKRDSCQAFVGKGSAGHFVKMVHNGIEYGLMQLIAEVYQILKAIFNLSNSQIADILSEWNEGELNSFLIEITSKILLRKDEETGKDLIEMISDSAEQKGTGKWLVQTALDFSCPVPTIESAVSMRQISAMQEQRSLLGKVLRSQFCANRCGFDFKFVKEALLLSFVVTYAQGFSLIKTASEKKNYSCNLAEIARIWRAGCIIRSRILEQISQVFEEESGLGNILVSDIFSEKVRQTYQNLKKACFLVVENELPAVGLTSSFNYLNAYASHSLPTNLIQAQRDFFGAHGYRRIDRDGIFHTNW